MKLVITALIRLYQRVFSPVLKWVVTGNPQGALCRFQPTCSHYCEEAVCRHGALKGLFLTFRRLLRCHPWGGHGYDPVPPLACLTSRAGEHAPSPDSSSNPR